LIVIGCYGGKGTRAENKKRRRWEGKRATKKRSVVGKARAKGKTGDRRTEAGNQRADKGWPHQKTQSSPVGGLAGFPAPGRALKICQMFQRKSEVDRKKVGKLEAKDGARKGKENLLRKDLAYAESGFY